MSADEVDEYLAQLDEPKRSTREHLRLSGDVPPGVSDQMVRSVGESIRLPHATSSVSSNTNVRAKLL